MKLPFETDQGIGTGANIGVVVLETDETLEYEFAQLIRGHGIALYHSRIPMDPQVRAETLATMEHTLPASVGLFPPALNFDAIGFACTSAATVIGSETVAKAVRAVRPGTQVTDPLAAVIAACAQLRVKRLAFITPYVPAVSEHMRQRLEVSGLEIGAFGSFFESDDRVVARITRGSILQAIDMVVAQAPCDAVFVSCTNLRCLNLIEEAEERTGKPVLSSNTALAWHLLKIAGALKPKPRFGKLFT